MTRTDINKVIGRVPQRILSVINRLPKAPFKESLTIRDYTGRPPKQN